MVEGVLVVGCKVLKKFSGFGSTAWSGTVVGREVDAHNQERWEVDWEDGDSTTHTSKQLAKCVVPDADAEEHEAAERVVDRDDGARFPKRNRTSRTVMVPSGYGTQMVAVLRENDYTLAEGEPTIAEKQAQRAKRAKEEARGAKEAKRKASAEAAARELKKKKKQEKKPEKKEKSSALSRQNDKVKRGCEAASGRREAFLHAHRKEIGPFIDAPTVAKLERSCGEEHNHRELYEQPEGIVGGELRDYQLEGLNFMVKMYDMGCGCVLGDEMGLGKTLQTIATISHLVQDRKEPGPALIACPLSVLASWAGEFKRWCPSLRVIRMHSSDVNERNLLKQRVTHDVGSYDVVFTTYEMLKHPDMASAWRRVWWSAVVLDEGHAIKNHETALAKAARGLHFRWSALLTGTPLQNDLVELWSLLNFLHPTTFTTSEPFEKAFDLRTKTHYVDAKMLERAHAALKVFMLRRLKETVEKSVPPKVETTIEVPLSPSQLFWYRRLLLKDSSILRKVEGASAGEYSRLNMLLVQLRKCCNHPFLFDTAEEDIDATTTAELVAASGKLTVFDSLLVKLLRDGHRCTVFSQYTRTLDILEDYLRGRDIKYSRLDGSTSRVSRSVAVAAFNAPGSRVSVFLMSTRAGGLGLNLQTADTCILFDSDWNPQPDLQAMARVHRIGQKKIVHVYRLVSAGTVEERILQRAQKKLYLDRMVNRDGAAAAANRAEEDDANPATGAAKLVNDLTFGADAIFSTGGGRRAPTDAELEAIVDRSPREELSTVVGALTTGTRLCALSFDAASVPIDTRSLCGRTHVASSVGDIGKAWRASELIQTDKRVSKKRLEMLESNSSGWGSKLVPVLKSNNYDLLDGEPSVHDRELKGSMAQPAKKPKKQRFLNEDHCLSCWRGGELLCCEYCPNSLCLECLGISEVPTSMWSCPQHACHDCGKRTAAAGGAIFRCVSCPVAKCHDCLPPVSTVIARSTRHEDPKCGYSAPSSCLYMTCSSDCSGLAKKRGELEFGEDDDHASSDDPARKMEPLDLSDVASIYDDADVDTAAAPASSKQQLSSLDAVFEAVDEARLEQSALDDSALEFAMTEEFEGATSVMAAPPADWDGNQSMLVKGHKWIRDLKRAGHGHARIVAAVDRWVDSGRLVLLEGTLAPGTAFKAEMAARADAYSRSIEREARALATECWPLLRSKLLAVPKPFLGRRHFTPNKLLCSLSDRFGHGTLCPSLKLPYHFCSVFNTPRKRELYYDTLDVLIEQGKLCALTRSGACITKIPKFFEDTPSSAVAAFGLNPPDPANAVAIAEQDAAVVQRVAQFAELATREVAKRNGAWTTLSSLTATAAKLVPPLLDLNPNNKRLWAEAIAAKAGLQIHAAVSVYSFASATYHVKHSDFVTQKHSNHPQVIWRETAQAWALVDNSGPNQIIVIDGPDTGAPPATGPARPCFLTYDSEAAAVNAYNARFASPLPSPSKSPSSALKRGASPRAATTPSSSKPRKSPRKTPQNNPTTIDLTSP